jgi:hypothetical protein
MLAMAIRALAAVSLGPKAEDAANEEQHRSLQFFEAQQSFQKKLEVGQARDERRQAARAKAIKAMAAELTNRQKTVIIRPVAASYVGREKPDNWSGLSLVLAAAGAGVLGIRGFLCHRSRQRDQTRPGVSNCKS